MERIAAFAKTIRVPDRVPDPSVIKAFTEEFLRKTRIELKGRPADRHSASPA
jgi:hypothetical protein